MNPINSVGPPVDQGLIIKCLHSFCTVTVLAILGRQAPLDVFWIPGFNMKAPWAVADLATRVLEVGRLVFGAEPTRFFVSSGVTLETLVKLSLSEPLFHFLDTSIRVGLLGIGLKVFIFGFMAILTRIRTHIGSWFGIPCPNRGAYQNEKQ